MQSQKRGANGYSSSDVSTFFVSGSSPRHTNENQPYYFHSEAACCSAYGRLSVVGSLQETEGIGEPESLCRWVELGNHLKIYYVAIVT